MIVKPLRVDPKVQVTAQGIEIVIQTILTKSHRLIGTDHIVIERTSVRTVRFRKEIAESSQRIQGVLYLIHVRLVTDNLRSERLQRLLLICKPGPEIAGDIDILQSHYQAL